MKYYLGFLFLFCFSVLNAQGEAEKNRTNQRKTYHYYLELNGETIAGVFNKNAVKELLDVHFERMIVEKAPDYFFDSLRVVRAANEGVDDSLMLKCFLLEWAVYRYSRDNDFDKEKLLEYYMEVMDFTVFDENIQQVNSFYKDLKSPFSKLQWLYCKYYCCKFLIEHFIEEQKFEQALYYIDLLENKYRIPARCGIGVAEQKAMVNDYWQKAHMGLVHQFDSILQYTIGLVRIMANKERDTFLLKNKVRAALYFYPYKKSSYDFFMERLHHRFSESELKILTLKMYNDISCEYNGANGFSECSTVFQGRKVKLYDAAINRATKNLTLKEMEKKYKAFFKESYWYEEFVY